MMNSVFYALVPKGEENVCFVIFQLFRPFFFLEKYELVYRWGLAARRHASIELIVIDYDLWLLDPKRSDLISERARSTHIDKEGSRNAKRARKIFTWIRKYRSELDNELPLMPQIDRTNPP